MSQWLLSFYGDDFTGSTDSMEALALHGVKTVLFLDVPPRDIIAERFPDVRAIGVAGISRSLAPVEMERELCPLFRKLAELRTPIVHYKMCSTFDSSPEIGSIGLAIDIGCETFDGPFVPLLVGAPALKRYTLFGHHFASIGDTAYRLDRHPVMSEHPLTPMDDSDLLLLLGRQTSRKSGLVDIIALQADGGEVKMKTDRLVQDGAEIVLFDVLDEESLLKTGELIWHAAQDKPLFTVGSSGVEYALGAHWQSEGRIERKAAFAEAGAPGPADAMLALSGSCSPVTRQQLEYAMDHGFTGLQADAVKLMDPDTARLERARLFEEASALLSAGGSVVVYTALGPHDDSIAAVKDYLKREGLAESESSRKIGIQLGLLCRELVEELSIRRVLVAGGDTSGYVTKELGVFALETIIPIAPGGPLCKGYSDHPHFDGIELALKGGQVGRFDYFIRVLQGGA
ncbi:four-carbon acid sugar kinase family protein [Paenibacillus koleovorans]|uniref:four-carbon acid sugar kinase family protein n=1 Tax=Paenibacillus koleovorans TaxID=121608 RepID=UPI001FE85DC6|nr:four-carbon acid sugar kinase family protein [Paenibacillus koleovorans]